MSKQAITVPQLSILHTTQNISRHSGVSVAVLQLLTAIAEQNPENFITLVAKPSSVPLLANTHIKANLEWKPLTIRNYQQVEQLFNSYESQIDHSEERFNLIHDHGIWLPLNHKVAIESRKRNIPRIVSPHGMLEPWSRQHKAWKKKLAWQIFQKFDLQAAHVLHATSFREALNLKNLFPKTPVAVIPFGVELPDYPNSNRPKFKSKSTVLFLSRIHKVKGLLNLVEAWNQLQPTNWTLLIAGPDEDGHRAEVEKRIQDLKVSETVKFLGASYGKEKWQLYQEADLFVLPTFTENFGMVIVEALASGVPVITTKGAPWSDLIAHRCGWWIDIGVAPLVEALREAISMSERERTEMGQRGRQLVESKYTWKSVATQMLSVYNWMIDQGTKPLTIID